MWGWVFLFFINEPNFFTPGTIKQTSQTSKILTQQNESVCYDIYMKHKD